MNKSPDIIIPTKLSQPPVRQNLVARQEIFKRLSEGISRKLTLVSAPAGFGKTSLVNAWLQMQLAPVSWLSLDKRDNDLSRFLTYLETSISSSVPLRFSSILESEGGSDQFASDSMLKNILEKLSNQSDFRIIVLDDYHLITLPAIHEAMIFLLSNLPQPEMDGKVPVRGCHFMIMTRSDPPFPLARWRVSGEVNEVRTDDLRFSLEESAELLNHNLSLDLTLEDIAELKSRAEGWVAGLHLAAVSMQGQDAKFCHQFINQLKGSYRLLSDYLIEEVFLQQPKKVQDFLLKSSILERMNGELCDAVLMDHGSKVILESLDRHNVFVVPLDHERQWYRYHHFFADVLSERFKASEQEDFALLHARAAQWLQDHGFIEGSVHHWLLAGEEDRADKLVVDVSTKLLDTGKFYELRTLVELFPEESFKDRPWLCVLRAWVCYFYQPDEMEMWLVQAERIIAEKEEDTQEVREILGHVAALRSIIRINMGRLEEALGIAAEGIAILPKKNFSISGLLLNAMGIIWMLKGDFKKSLDYYMQAKTTLLQGGNYTAAARALDLAGNIEVERGSLHHALSIYKEGYSLSGVGKVMYEWNQLDEALEAFERAYDYSKRDGIAVEISRCVPLARALVELGKMEKAKKFFDRYAEYIGYSSLTPWLDSELVAFQIEYLSALGDFRAVDYLASNRGIVLDKDFEPALEAEYTAYAFSFLRRGDLDEVMRTAPVLEQRMAQWGLTGRQINLLAIQAAAYQLAGETDTAQTLIAKALTLGAEEGHIRTFVALGEPVLEVIAGLSQNEFELDRAYVREVIAAFLNSPSGGTLSSPVHHEYMGDQPDQQGVLIEPLTSRELEVLHLVAAEQNNQEIAGKLNISINTVKTHVSNIFTKLGVSNRLQAANRARQLDII